MTDRKRGVKDDRPGLQPSSFDLGRPRESALVERVGTLACAGAADLESRHEEALSDGKSDDDAEPTHGGAVVPTPVPGAARPALAPGARLGPYEILGPLGAGGMGEVYRARDVRLDRTVAIKVLPAHYARNPEQRARLEREGRAVSRLNHAHICALYDIGQQDGVDFLVIEHLEGQSLAERLKAGPMPLDQVLRYGIEVARALHAAHQEGVVHRDLKPGNLMLTRSGAKLLDFGLAKVTGPVASGVSAPALTTEGLIVGTFQYIAPEQLEAREADARSDIFALGLLLFEMATGRRAFQGDSQASLAAAILKDDPPSLTALRPAAPAALERLVRACLAKDPDDRVQSAHDVMQELRWIQEDLSRQVPPSAIRVARRERLAWAVALAVLAAVFFLWPRRPAEAPAFERLTFRRGTIESARFTPDGQAIVYGAAWAGTPVEVFAGRLGSPESRPLGFAGAELLAISAAGEMALSLERRRIGTFVATGVLARAPLAGGAPRPLQEDVQGADFAPDGSLAVVRSVGGRNRLEFPIGTVLYETAGWVSHPRFSPAGDRIAFLDHPVWGDDGGHVAVVDLKGNARTLSRNWGSVQGLAWPPGGREIWLTGTRAGAARALVALGLDGRERVIAHMAGVLTLHDVSREGRVLLSHHDQRREIVALASGAESERDLSWLDYCFPSDLSDDGSTVYFAENGEGGGPGYSVYLRRTDGSAPALRLGGGAAMALSPDGRFGLASRNFTSDEPELTLIPTGTGEPRALPRGGVNTQAASFFPDGRRVLLAGGPPGRPTRTWVQELAGGDPRPLTADGTRFQLSARPVSPDGRTAVVQDAEGRHLLVPTEGGAPRALAGLDAAEQPLRWSADGRSLFAYRPGQVPARVFRLDVASGRREPWLTVAPADLSGVLAVGPVLLTPDGRTYVYGYRRVVSDLYAVSGLR
jgi:Tol biopolymer transport system component